MFVAFACLATATGAFAATGRPVAASDNPPSAMAPIRTAGLMCRADSVNFRAWWGDTPGAAGALPAADASCATVPPVVGATLQAAESIRLASQAAGFPQLVGDRPLVFARSGGWYLNLVRTRPAARAAFLGRTPSATRGRLLAGLRPTERKRVYRGLPSPLVTRLKRDVARAPLGRPRDFVGGDRRLDLMFDGTGATGWVNTSVAGRAPCTQAVIPGRRAFISGSAILFAPDTTVQRAVLAHELFHTVQCILGVPGGTVGLLGEGTAEWQSGAIEPIDFAGAEIVAGNGHTIIGGAARAISFCNNFDPNNTTGLDGYQSFGVWAALELTAPGTILGVLTAGAATPFTTTQGVLAYLGDARWSDALAVATREICGNLRTPSGQTVFPAGIRAFFGADPGAPLAQPTVPAAMTLAPGGVRSIPITWASSSATSVTVQVAAVGIDPSTLSARTYVHVAGALAPVGTEDATGAAAVLTTAQVAARGGAVTVANPSSATPVSITVTVTATP